MRIIPIKTDYAFKELMSHEAIRKQFISDVLQIPLEKIRSVQLSTPFLRRGYRRQKQGILDVEVVMNDDTKMDIEMQLRPQLLNAESTEDLDKIVVHNEGMKEAKEVVKAMSLGRGLKWMYDQHQKALRDRWAEDEYVRDEGRAEGRAANLIDNVEELCRNMDVEPKTACKMIGVTYEQYASALSIMKEARNGQKK